MWWQQSLAGQSFQYSHWKNTNHTFTGRNQDEATKKMNRFLDIAQITGRFLCVENGYELTTTGEETKSHIEQILGGVIQ